MVQQMTFASTKDKNKPLFRQMKLMMLFLIIYFVVGLIPIYLLFSLTVDALNREAGIRLQAVATFGAKLIDGDLHAKIRTKDDVGSDAYKKVKAQMRSILHSSPDLNVVHIYTLRKSPKINDHTYFVIDSAEVTDFSFFSEDDISKFGYPYCLGPGMKKAFAGNPSSTGFIYGNNCGSWRTGYAPIRTSDGKIDAILCVDGSAEDTLAQMEKCHSWGKFSIILSIIFLFLVTIVIGISSSKENSNEKLQLSQSEENLP